jgi:sigma-B regulation protein RsbU (phosphoserine phosphatase)
MRILIADDEPLSRSMLLRVLNSWGHEVIDVKDGSEAWDVLRSGTGPQMALLDWIMPEMDGVEVIRRVRESVSTQQRYTYMILLTQKGSKEEVVQGLGSGADDYMVKPFDPNELRVRIRSGERILELQSELVTVNKELQDALAQVKKLSGLLPICASCKKIRDDEGYWQQIEGYIRTHSEADFTHGICPDCAVKLYPDLYGKEE